MTQLYVVVENDYDGYRIEAIYDNLAAAEFCRDDMNEVNNTSNFEVLPDFMLESCYTAKIGD